MTVDTGILRRAVASPQVGAARATVRRAIRKVRCENRVISRYGFNLVPSIRYRRDPVDLVPAGRGVVEELRRDGVAMSTVDALLGDRELFGRIRTRVQAMVDDQAEAIEAQRARLIGEGAGAASKDFLVELMGKRPALEPADPLLEFGLHEQILGIAEEYSQCTLKLHDVNAWLNLASEHEATQSQRWHRDLPEDHDIVKCFLYIDDVPLGAGPLEYIQGSNTRDGRKLTLPSTWDGIGYRIEEKDLFTTIAPERLVRAEGTAGSLAFADTRGLHRGGWARTQDRLVVQYLFASAACCRPRALRAAPGVRAGDLPRVNLGRPARRAS